MIPVITASHVRPRLVALLEGAEVRKKKFMPLSTLIMGGGWGKQERDATRRGQALNASDQAPASQAQRKRALFGYRTTRPHATLASLPKYSKNTKMQVFAIFASKRAKPRTTRPRAILHRAEVVKNSKRSRNPKFFNLVEKIGLGWTGWVGLGWAGLGCFENYRPLLDWVETGLEGFFKKN